MVIYIPKTLNNIEKIYLDEDEIKQYLGNNKLFKGTMNDIAFEIFRDFGDPLQEWIPFLFYNRIQN